MFSFRLRKSEKESSTGKGSRSFGLSWGSKTSRIDSRGGMGNEKSVPSCVSEESTATAKAPEEDEVEWPSPKPSDASKVADLEDGQGYDKDVSDDERAAASSTHSTETRSRGASDSCTEAFATELAGYTVTQGFGTDASFQSLLNDSRESDERVMSTVVRRKESRPFRRTLSDPTGLSRSIELSMSMEIDPPPGSPFEEAIRLQQLLGKKKHGLKRMGRSRYERKKKKGEITQEHEQYSITYCMMLGIRFSVSRQSPVKVDREVEHVASKEKRSLTIDDFMHVDRLVFDPSGSKNTPPHPLGTRFKFKDYAPEVFRQLRVKFGIDDRDYMLSLCGKYNYIEFISNSKSGQFFFYSNDGHFLIKTQSKAESKFMRQILPRYYMYMSENEDSLLVRICGMHRVRLSHLGRNMHFVILKSVYSNAAARKIHTVYDLKGSTLGRSAKPGEAVFKDLDLIRNNQRFKLGSLKDSFLSQLEKDAKFLAQLHIMDYSLLVGIHNKIAPPVAKSIGVLTGESSRTLGQHQGSGNKRHSGLEMLSPKQRVPSRGYRSYTMPGVRRTKEWALQHRASSTSKSASPLEMSHASLRRSKRNLFTVDQQGEKSPCAFGGGPDWNRPRPLECEDADEYFDESDEDQEEPSHPDSKFSPVEAQDDAGRPGTEIYYFGVIDILQQYNTRKRGENIVKSLVQGGDSSISSVNPSKYAARFVKFIREHVE